MYKEPRSLALAQRIVTWVYATCCSVAAPPADPAVEDQRLVAQCSGNLEISEFELFARAYRAWYGRAPVERDLEREFYAFLTLRSELPFYVRRFVTRVTTLTA